MYFKASCSRAQQRFLALLVGFHMKSFEKLLICSKVIIFLKTKKNVKKVFLEIWCRQTVNIVFSPDVCWLRKDLCLPLVPLTSLSDSLSDSWDASVTLWLLSFFHTSHHLDHSTLYPSLISEYSHKVAPSERFPLELQGLLSISEISCTPTSQRRLLHRDEKFCTT